MIQADQLSKMLSSWNRSLANSAHSLLTNSTNHRMWTKYWLVCDTHKQIWHIFGRHLIWLVHFNRLAFALQMKVLEFIPISYHLHSLVSFSTLPLAEHVMTAQLVVSSNCGLSAVLMSLVCCNRVKLPSQLCQQQMQGFVFR